MSGTGVNEDFDLSYRKIAVQAGWNLLLTGTDITDSSQVILPANYVSASEATTSNFGAKVVDFGAFTEAEPEPNLIDFAVGVQVSMLTVAVA